MVPNSLVELDSATGRVVGDAPVAGVPEQVDSSGASTWITTASRTLSAISPATLRARLLTTPNLSIDQLAIDGDRMWAVDGSGRKLARIDPAYGTVRRAITLPPVKSGELTSVRMAPANGGVWVTDGGTDLLFYGAGGRLLHRVDLHRSLGDVAVGEGSLWALSSPTATVVQLDPSTGRVQGRIRSRAIPAS